MKHSRLLAILGFVLMGIMSRFIPHLPNFTAINALALFSAFYLGSPWTAFAAMFTCMFLSDLVLGLHSSMAFVYLSFGLVVLFGHWFNQGKSLRRVPACCLLSSLLFFIVTNLGEWLSGSLYAPTLNGLGLCYAAALPFLANQVFGDLFYGVVIFGGFALSKRLFPAINEQDSYAF